MFPPGLSHLHVGRRCPALHAHIDAVANMCQKKLSNSHLMSSFSLSSVAEGTK